MMPVNKLVSLIRLLWALTSFWRIKLHLHARAHRHGQFLSVVYYFSSDALEVKVYAKILLLQMWHNTL